MDIIIDIAAGFVLAVLVNFTALGFSAMFRGFRLVADAG